MPQIEEIMQNVLNRANAEPEFRAQLEKEPLETLQKAGYQLTRGELETFLGSPEAWRPGSIVTNMQTMIDKRVTSTKCRRGQ
jgi:hypothetical protein